MFTMNKFVSRVLLHITQVATLRFWMFQRGLSGTFLTPEGGYVYRKRYVQTVAPQRGAMSINRWRLALHISMCLVLIASVVLCGCSDKQSTEKPKTDNTASQEREWLSILGGTIGGSFSQFAGGVRQVVTKHEPHLKISVDGSAGSVENTRRVNEDPEALGVVFAAESYLGYHGKDIFAEEGPKTNIRVVTLLFVAYDQFSTLANSDVHQFEDIVGRKIAAGASGSGTAQTLERLSKLAGIWGEFTPIYKGGTAAAEALQNGQVDGFQWLVSVPNSAVIELTTIKSIRMLDLDTPAKKYGFYEKYPFYLSGSLPEGAYEGKVKPVKLF